MIPPKRVLNILNEHWSLIVYLTKHYQQIFCTAQEIQGLLKQFNPDYNSDKAYRECQKLLQLEVLIPLAKSSQLELNRSVYEFSSYLLQEEHLGLAEEIKILVADMGRLGLRLQQAGEVNDSNELHRYRAMLDDRVRKVIKLFNHNENAILNLVENAKTQDNNMSLTRRYQAVIEAFDEYIEPMLEMIDIGGEFQHSFSRVEEQISELILKSEHTGHLNEHKRALQQLRTRILEMHWLGRESLRRSADVLMPLREALRRNTLLSKKASFLLSKIRKTGVETCLNDLVPHIHSDAQKRSLGTRNQMVACMAQMADYEDVSYQLPEEAEKAGYSAKWVPDYIQVRKAYNGRTKKKNQQNLVNWLTDSYPELETDELLFLYQRLAQDPKLAMAHSDKAEQLEINEHRLTLYPFSPHISKATKNS